MLFSPDRYVSTASLSIKDTDIQSMPSSFLDGLGFSGTSAGESENLIKAYIHSPNLLLALEEEMNVKNHYTQSNDFLFGLKESDEFEDYIGFYQQMVSVDIDVNTGLLTIEVQAYSPEFSKQLADALLRYGELFINQANQSVAEEEMQFSVTEIERNQQKLKSAKLALLRFQNKYNLISPQDEGASLFDIVYQLESELAKTEAAITQNKSFLNDDAPHLRALQNKASGLRSEIKLQKRRVMGTMSDNIKINDLSAEYQSLVLDIELSTSLYSSALSAYEVTRLQTLKKIKHLIVVAKPRLAEKALYPQRAYIWLTCLLILIALHFLVNLILVSVYEHQD